MNISDWRLSGIIALWILSGIVALFLLVQLVGVLVMIGRFVWVCWGLWRVGIGRGDKVQRRQHRRDHAKLQRDMRAYVDPAPPGVVRLTKAHETHRQLKMLITGEACREETAIETAYVEQDNIRLRLKLQRLGIIPSDTHTAADARLRD